MGRPADTDGLVAMTQEEFRLVRDVIRGYCGIHFGDDMRYVIQRRLSPRLVDLGCGDFTEYYHHLVYHPNRQLEFEEIVERVTTNETYFFREAYQLRAFSEEILPELHSRCRRGKRLTLWSAGCSTGEEVYTLAILILESGLFEDWEVRVFGSDISRRVLTVARKGIYGRSSFRATEDRFLRRYFREVEGRFQVADGARALVSFGQLNLVDDDHLALIAEVDVVLCRNVLIYFEAPERRKVIDAIYRKLVPGGYLLLGHSESLINLSTAFELVHLKNDMVYRKPQAASGGTFDAARWGLRTP
jgi:chemotaxis protein methyltransferase CheR